MGEGEGDVRWCGEGRGSGDVGRGKGEVGWGGGER